MQFCTLKQNIFTPERIYKEPQSFELQLDLSKRHANFAK